jgi:SAM-dependent methyltransferase
MKVCGNQKSDPDKFRWKDDSHYFKEDEKKEFSYEIPKISLDGIATRNKMGFMTLSLDPFSDRFTNFVAKCENPVLEIGCAYGIASLKALSLGAHVFSNDLDAHHLNVLEERCPEEHRTRLTTILGNFNEIEFPSGFFGAILSARVIHFMTGNQIRKLLSNCYNQLSTNGKLFIVADSCYQKDALKFIPTFEDRLKRNEEWPGLVEDVSSLNSTVEENIQKLFHFIDPFTLKRELERANFYVEEVIYFSREDYSEWARLDGREGVGAIAIKL